MMLYKNTKAIVHSSDGYAAIFDIFTGVLQGDKLVGWLFGFYGISTFVGHSTANSVYIYIHIQPKISKQILR